MGYLDITGLSRFYAGIKAKFLLKATVVNNLTTSDTDKPLSAAQGKELDEKKLNKTDVANNLNTTDTGKALSAYQGKVLKDEINTAKRYTLLYTNAAPASVYAQQTVAMDLSGYQSVLIEFFANGGWFDWVGRINVPISRTGAMTIALAEYNNLRTCHRTATPTATGVAFSHGYVRIATDTSAGTQNNQCSVPYRIWGAEGV